MDHGDANTTASIAAWVVKAGYITLAAAAGAVTALSSMKWQQMSRGEIALTVGGGFFFAIFVTPWLAHEIFGVEDNNLRAITALTYVFGSASNILLPRLIRWISNMSSFGGDK